MRQIALRALVGLGLGFGVAVLQFVVVGAVEAVENAVHHTVEPFSSIYRTLNAPAELLQYYWRSVLDLPPRGEAAWVVVPIVTVLLQWCLIGFLAGLWWGFNAKSSASGGDGRVWLVVLAGGAAIIICGLVAFILGTAFSPLTPPEDAKAQAKPSVAREEPLRADEAFKAIEANPNDAEAHYRLGVTLASDNKVDAAMAQFRRALELRSAYAEAHYQMGLILTRMGKLADAITSYRKALMIRPDFIEARQQLDAALRAQDEKTVRP